MIFPVIEKLKLWQKYLIWAYPGKLYIACDPATKDGDESCKITHKKIKGVYYILKCEHEGDLK